MSSDRRGSGVPSGPSSGLLLEMVSQNHQMAEDGHKRLRADIRELEKDLDKLTAQHSTLIAQCGDLTARFKHFETTPLNVDKVSFSGKQIAVVAAACAVLLFGMWQVHVGVEGLQASIQNASKLQDERNETQKQAMDQLRAAIEMRRVEIQNLANYIQQNVTPQRPGARP